MKKDMGNWCKLHKVHVHNTYEFHSKKSFVAKMKALESNAGYNSESDLDKGKWIIDIKPLVVIAATKV